MTRNDDALDLIFRQIKQELSDAMCAHESMHSAHEAYAVIAEELDEFWDNVRLKKSDRSNAKMRNELIQTAAMCVRAIHDLGLLRDSQ